MTQNKYSFIKILNFIEDFGNEGESMHNSFISKDEISKELPQMGFWIREMIISKKEKQKK